MITLEGILLHKKTIGGKNGKQPLNIVSILDENERFSRVLDLADFDSRFHEVIQGQKVEVPISIRLAETETNAYLNWAVAGQPSVVG